MASRPFQFCKGERSQIKKSAAKHFEGLAALSTHPAGRRSRPGVTPFISALTVARCPATFPGVWPQLRDILGLLTKCLFIYFERKNGSKKDAHRRHPIHLIILFKFKAVAERRQWPSAASKPRRKTRVKLCPHFWAAKVPSHQICRLRSASR